ncbi:protelomerase family protein [Magnetospirillum molischianum]|uniref:Telomere resolvase ResT/TelK catalytic domain-containing protein n=1 Tax=Magnetospirillum molischianum DSM 120 TaxID=1150626 RepID=H8FVE8_MAGML|nr:protelomerase family protein [Magnetospirillum molischianum]CCG42336.1 hypothetical protein PHAMO_380004 [Magnetospirillum molischianum DSM 120]
MMKNPPKKKLRPDVATFIEEMAELPLAQHAAYAQREINRLRDSLSLNSLKTYLSLRRTAVRERFGVDDGAFDLLRLTDDEYAQLRQNYQSAVSLRQAEPIRIRHSREMLFTAREMLKTDDRYALILGLALLTGRRPNEIACNPKTRFDFIPIPSVQARAWEKWHIRFRGQVKTRNAKGTMTNSAFTIPVLAPAKEIREAFVRLRDRIAPDLVGMDYEEFNRASNTPLNRRCKAVFGRFWSNDDSADLAEARVGTKARGKRKLEGASVSARDMRIIYAEICSRIFNKTGTNEERCKPSEYYARILGHRENDLTTAQSYAAVVLEDLPRS